MIMRRDAVTGPEKTQRALLPGKHAVKFIREDGVSDTEVFLHKSDLGVRRLDGGVVVGH